MQTLLLTLILIIVTSYFSSQNTLGVTIRFANQTLGIFPLYVIVIFSILLGFLVAYIFALTERIRREKQINRDKKFIKYEEKSIQELKKLIDQLENENARMKIELKAYSQTSKNIKENRTNDNE